jgi:hypothetical protein
MLPLAAQSAGKKVALVIGNSAYGTSPLKNPANDATDMSAVLKRLGFTVYSGTDMSRKNMYSLIDQFGEDIRGAGIALFYYSGHGVQMDGENYLIPIGAAVSIAEDVETEGVQLERIIGRMNAGGADTNIVILDACRDNPFPSAAKGMERGLAVVGQKPPESVIVYATEAGETAADGGGRNGVFTTALLSHIGEKVALTTILHEVSADVREATNQKQKPARYDNLDHEVWLSGAATSSTAGMAPQVPTLSAERRSFVSLPKASIRIDGNFGAWAGIPPAFLSGTKAPRNKQLAIEKVYLAVDDKNLYMRIDIKDDSPSTLLHPDNFDSQDFWTQYGINISNGDNLVQGMVSFDSKANFWKVVVRRKVNGRWENLSTTNNYSMKGPSLEAAFPLEVLKENLGELEAGAYYLTNPNTGHSDQLNHGKWVPGDSVPQEMFIF